MRKRIGAVVAALLAAPGAAALTAPSSALAHTKQRRPLRAPSDYHAWSRVAHCESGGWRVLGWSYPDSLGITRANYVRFGGVPLPPGPVPMAARLREIRVADRLIAHYHFPIPDQYGCAAW